jgi:hypothetical protein
VIQGLHRPFHIDKLYLGGIEMEEVKYGDFMDVPNKPTEEEQDEWIREWASQALSVFQLENKNISDYSIQFIFEENRVGWTATKNLKESAL